MFFAPHYAYGKYTPSKSDSNIQPFKPKLECIKLPSTDSKLLSIALITFAVITVGSLPFAGIPFHLLTMKSAIELAITDTCILSIGKYLKNVASSEERKLELKTKYKQKLKQLVKGKLNITDLSVEEFRNCLEAAPLTDEAFFKECKETSSLKYGLKPIGYAGSIPSCYDLSFEEKGARTEYEKASLSNLGFKEPPKGRVGFINGMLTNYAWSYRHALLISYLSGGYNVHLVHNPTHGFVTDLQECRLGLHKGIVTDPVWHLHHMWDDFFHDKNTGEDEEFLQICHSQGAIHVMNALKHYPEKYRKRIKVVAIAPGGYIQKGLSKEAFHYVSRDFIPKLDSSGQSKAAKIFYCNPCSAINHGFSDEIYYDPLREHLIPFTRHTK